MKLQPFAKNTILNQLISNLAWVITLGRPPALPNFGSDPMSGRDVTWCNMYGTCDFILYSSTELQPIPVNQFLSTIAQKTRSGVRKTLLGREKYNSEILGCFTLKICPKWVGKGHYQPK